MFFKVYFIKLKDVSETIIENYFAMKKANSLSVNKIKMLLFALNKLYCLSGKRLLRYLNVSFDFDIFEYAFLTFRPRVDYFDDYFKIVNQR